MILFIDPSELSSNSKWPQSIKSVECPGLEALTGADFVISKLPISPVSNLDWHIQNRSLFVNRKTGYDVFNFEQMNVEVARMKAAGIPMQQCFILFIGRCHPDALGLAVIDGKKPYGDTTYRTFEKRQSLVEARGVKFRQIASTGDLETWIEVQGEMLLEIEKQPVKSVNPPKPTVQWSNEEDIWQETRLPDENSPEYSLVCGIKGLGAKTVESAILACRENYLTITGINLLKVLTYRDEKGKLLYKVNGWGDKSADRVRQMLGLRVFDIIDIPDKKKKRWYQNIHQATFGDDTDVGYAWWNGVNDGLDTLQMLSKEHKINNANQLLFLARRAAVSFGLVDKEQVDKWLEDLYCDDWLKTKYPNIYQEFLKGKVK